MSRALATTIADLSRTLNDAMKSVHYADLPPMIPVPFAPGEKQPPRGGEDEWDYRLLDGTEQDCLTGMDDDDGQPDEAQEWHDYDPEC